MTSVRLPATASVEEFRAELRNGLNTPFDKERKWGDAKWGCYAFYDYDKQPIYVGQTIERLRVRVGRHLTNQRTDVVAMRILDVFEVAEVELFPLWEYQEVTTRSPEFPAAKRHLDALEFALYQKVIQKSLFQAVLNEQLPRNPGPLDSLPPSLRFSVAGGATRAEREHDDVRLARRAETISRLAAVAHERGNVTPNLRRVLVVQAARLTLLAAARLAEATGNPKPEASLIDLKHLVFDMFDHTDLNYRQAPGDDDEPDEA